MQPEFDDAKDDERLNAILERIKKKGAKRSASTEDVFKHGIKKRSTVLDKKHHESIDTTVSIASENSAEKTASAGETEKSKKRSKATSENGCPPKRTKKSGKKNTESELQSDDPSCPINKETENREGTEEGKPMVLSEDKRKVDSAAREPCKKAFEFVMPKPVSKQNGSIKLTLLSKKGGRPQMPSPASQSPSSSSKAQIENETSDQKIREVPCNKERPAQSRPLGFIENITRDKEARKVELEEKPQRQTRRSVGLAGSVHNSFVSQPQTKEVHPFVAQVLETLAKKKKPQLSLKSPWRRQSEATQRRQSPRLSALRRRSSSDDVITDENMSPVVPKQKEPRKPVPAVPCSASAHMLKFWKAKPSKVTSPEVALLDISFGPAQLSERRSSNVSSASSLNTASSHQGTPDNRCSKSLLETLSSDLTDLDRSDSPILGTRVKRRVPSSGSNSSRTSTKSPYGVTPLQNKASVTAANNSSLSSSVNCSKFEGKEMNESLNTSTRSRRGSRQKEALPTLVCTHLTGR